MNNERIAELFVAALERPAEERQAYLEQAAGDAPEIRAEVVRLLAGHREADPFLDAPLDPDRAATLLDEDEALVLEERVGPYRLLREAGRGGMGTVYLAERSDGQFEQRVALKLVKRGMDSDVILRRFLQERQILARLEHPQIARLYDGGLSADGRPYFAMEYVEGVAITQYCAERRLDVEARLRLFQDVCQAVQHAHGNLVIHRDLKPSNVLVTTDGAVKLLDFGIARLLDDGQEAGQTALTATGWRAMTPDYAAPEQVGQGPLTTATDVYGLGLVLYELLTGHQPFRFPERTPEAVARVLAESEAERPSSAVGRTEVLGRADGERRSITPQQVGEERGTTPERLRRRLRGDLDRVALKALAKEPERRYASAEALLEDIGRHLEGLPVRAQRDTLRYRTAKFVRRHVAAVLVAAAFVLLLAGFAVTMALERNQTARERDRAEAVRDFVLSLFEASNPLIEAKGDEVTARELLERGVARIDEELVGQPRTEAEMLAVIGNAYKELGRYDRAQPLLEKALALRRDHLGAQHPEVARSLYDLADLEREMGDYEAAESSFREALAMQRQLLSADHLDVSATLNDLGLLLLTRGDYAAAEPQLREALAMRRRLLGGEHPDVATSMDHLAGVLRAKGDYAAAEPLYREALAIRQKALGDEHPDVASSLSGLAVLLRLTGKYDEAEPLSREALAMRRKLLGDEHTDVATSLNNLALLLREMGEHEAAEPLLRETLGIYRKSLGEEHLYVATALSNLAMLLVDLSDYEEAEIHVREALAIYRKQLGEDHPFVADQMVGLAGILRRKGDVEAAEPLLRQALDLLRARLPEGHLRLVPPLSILGQILMDAGRAEEAEPLLREALKVVQETLPEEHWRRGAAESLLGDCLSRLERCEEAEPLLIAGYTGVSESRGEGPLVERALEELVAHYDRCDRPDQAAAYRAQLEVGSRTTDPASD